MCVDLCVICVYISVYLCVCVSVCVRARAHACAHTCLSTLSLLLFVDLSCSSVFFTCLFVFLRERKKTWSWMGGEDLEGDERREEYIG